MIYNHKLNLLIIYHILYIYILYIIYIIYSRLILRIVISITHCDVLTDL